LGSFRLDLEGAASRIVDKPVTKLIKATVNVSKSLLNIIDSNLKADIVLNITTNLSSELIDRIDSTAKSVAAVVDNMSVHFILAAHNATKMIETSAEGFLGEFENFNSKVENFNSKVDVFVLLAICIGAYYCLLIVKEVVVAFSFCQPDSIITQLLLR